MNALAIICRDWFIRDASRIALFLDNTRGNFAQEFNLTSLVHFEGVNLFILKQFLILIALNLSLWLPITDRNRKVWHRLLGVHFQYWIAALAFFFKILACGKRVVDPSVVLLQLAFEMEMLIGCFFGIYRYLYTLDIYVFFVEIRFAFLNFESSIFLFFFWFQTQLYRLHIIFLPFTFFVNFLNLLGLFDTAAVIFSLIAVFVNE